MANLLPEKLQLIKDEAGAVNEPVLFDAEQFLEDLPAPGHNSATDYLWPPLCPQVESNNGRGSPPPCTTLQEATGSASMTVGLQHAPAPPLQQTGLVAAEVQSWSFAAGTPPEACLYELGTGQVHMPDHGLSTLNAALPTSPPPSVNTPPTMQMYSIAEVGGNNTSVTLRVETDDIFMEDGFTWRKYGNKPIKNMAFKKAYFKCAEHGKGCNAVRWIQKCTDEEGCVDFTYKGRHNHPRPGH